MISGTRLWALGLYSPPLTGGDKGEGVIYPPLLNPLPPGERKNKDVVFFLSPEPNAQRLVSLITSHASRITHYDLGPWTLDVGL